jgi:electron transport complex protein RnfC
MRLLGLGTFRHGIHPPDAKQATAERPIRRLPFAPLLVVPLVQHIGAPSQPVVGEGERVERGQTIARPDGFVSVAMHAPASGTVRRIALAPRISGRMVPAVMIEPHPASTQEVAEGKPCPLETATPEEIILAIQQAGVVGLGGAAFPTHVKLRLPEGASLDTLIINGVECEPYLTTDHRVPAPGRWSSASRPTKATRWHTCAPGCPKTSPPAWSRCGSSTRRGQRSC